MPYQVDVNGEFRKIGLDFVVMDRAPTAADNTYTAPFGWLDTAANIWYVLVDNTSGTATWESAAGAAGDVTGPGSSTDNAAVRFDGATGKIIQNSGVIIDDSDNVTGVNDLTTTGTTTFGKAFNADRTATAVGVNSAGETIIGVTSTAAPRAIVLDTDDVVDGRVIWVKDESGGAGTNNITISTEGAETIDGAATFVISTNYGVMGFYSDGSNWFTIDSEGSGGLTNFTESEDSGTQITDSLTCNGTNANFGIIPNGTGAIVADIPDGTTTGGNSRGQYAVDLQLERNQAADVASGNYSGIFAGKNSEASGEGSVCVGGSGNIVDGQYSFAIAGTSNDINSTKGSRNGSIGGQLNTVDGAGAVSIGGFGGTVDEDYAIMLGGIGNVAQHYASVAMGDRASTNIFSQFAFAGGRFASGGDSQGSLQVARCITTGTGSVDFKIGGSSFGAASSYIVVPSDTLYQFTVKVIAIDTTGGSDAAWWEVIGGIKNISGTTSLIGTNVVTTDGDAGSAAWTLSVTADDTNDRLNIAATGDSSTTIRWTATVFLSEVAQ